MDINNLFREDNDFNICKSWLCGSTDGDTYSISAWFEKKLPARPDGVSESKYEEVVPYDLFYSGRWEDSIGYKHDYKVDDPKVDDEARKMAKNLNEIIDEIKAKVAKLAEEAKNDEYRENQADK